MRNPVEGEARSGVALLFMRPQLLHTERFFRVPAGMGSAPCWLVHKNGTFDSTSGASQSKVPLNAANGSSKRLIGHRQTPQPPRYFRRCRWIAGFRRILRPTLSRQLPLGRSSGCSERPHQWLLPTTAPQQRSKLPNEISYPCDSLLFAFIRKAQPVLSWPNRHFTGVARAAPVYPIVCITSVCKRVRDLGKAALLFGCDRGKSAA